jgi:hypothetical protein
MNSIKSVIEFKQGPKVDPTKPPAEVTFDFGGRNLYIKRVRLYRVASSDYLLFMQKRGTALNRRGQVYDVIVLLPNYLHLFALLLPLLLPLFLPLLSYSPTLLPSYSPSLLPIQSNLAI